MFEDVSEPLHVIVNYGQKVRVSVFCHKIDCFGICLRFLISQNIKILLIKKLEKFSITKMGSYMNVCLAPYYSHLKRSKVIIIDYKNILLGISNERTLVSEFVIWAQK